MMSTKLRIVSILLALLTVEASAISCSDSEDDKQTPSASISDASAETRPLDEETIDPNDRSQIKDNLPENLDLDGRNFNIYCSISSKNDKYFQGTEEQSGDVVNDAIRARNTAAEERLNIKLRTDSYDDSWDTVARSISKLIMANDDTYDVFMGQQSGITQLTTDNCFVNTFDLENIDFSQPWWNTYYMEQLSLGKNYRFYLVGDYFIDALANERTIFFNKALYTEYYDQADALYQEVLDGKWTIDRMSELAKNVFVDLDNNGTSDITDQLGFVSYGTGSSVDAFVYGTDIAFSSRDNDGFITLNMMNDDAVVLAEKLVELFYQSGSCFKAANDNENYDTFINGRALFLGNATLATANKLRDMKDDFGYLPYPKFDEEQKNYCSVVHDAVLIGAVSGASQNLDIAGTVLEALNAETYRSVTPVWYETALKIKYSRDDLSSQMIDLIHDAMTTNFVFAYNTSLDGIGWIYRELVSQKSTDYASKVKSKEKSAQRRLSKLVDAFTAED